MKSLAGLGIVLSLMGQASAAPPARLASAHIDSLELVQLMHLDELLSRTLNEHAQQALAAGRVTKTQFACMKVKSADFTEGMATAARRELTSAEIASAIDYLRSKDGSVFGEAMIDPDKTAALPLEVSPSEAAAFATFRDSSVGKKLYATSMLMASAGARDFLEKFGNQLKAKCQLTQPLQPPQDSKPQPDNRGAASSRTGS
jgi:hypothetical protein